AGCSRRAAVLMAAETLPALDCACASLRRAARAVTQAYEAALKHSGLRATQFTLLQVLERTGTSPQAALGELLALDPTTLSRTLTRALSFAATSSRTTPRGAFLRHGGRLLRQGESGGREESQERPDSVSSRPERARSAQVRP